MLVLSRKLGEKIYIGPGITITVIEVKGNKTRLGIDAPADVPIVRAELNSFLGAESDKPQARARFELEQPC